VDIAGGPFQHFAVDRKGADAEGPGFAGFVLCSDVCGDKGNAAHRAEGNGVYLGRRGGGCDCGCQQGNKESHRREIMARKAASQSLSVEKAKVSSRIHVDTLQFGKSFPRFGRIFLGNAGVICRQTF
jgi:hypothetical protein